MICLGSLDEGAPSTHLDNPIFPPIIPQVSDDLKRRDRRSNPGDDEVHTRDIFSCPDRENVGGPLDQTALSLSKYPSPPSNIDNQEWILTPGHPF